LILLLPISLHDYLQESSKNFLVVDITNLFKAQIFNIALCNWILGYFFAFFLAYLIHFIAYLLVKPSSPSRKLDNEDLQKNFFGVTIFWFITDKEGKSHKNIRRNQITGFILKLFSPDYSSANTFKSILVIDALNPRCPKRVNSPHNIGKRKNAECEINEKGVYSCEIHYRKNRRKDFIIYSNWANIISACFISILTLFNDNEVFLVFLLFHIFSRIIEVVSAFYKDVVQSKMKKDGKSFGYKSSNLKRGNRISLALHSYLEFILLFTCVYYLLDNHLNNEFSNLNSFIDYLLYSMSVSAYNFSLDLKATTLGKVVHIAQVFTSMTLVVLSIASYLGLEDEMSEYEKIEWENREYN